MGLRAVGGRLSQGLACLYALDRLVKLAAIETFYRRLLPAAPDRWPSILLVQPITRGATNLRGNLRARAGLVYAGTIEHCLVCDARDEQSLAICRAAIAETPELQARIVLVHDKRGQEIVLKTPKLLAGLVNAQAEVLVFIDDDVAPRPDALQRFVRQLQDPTVGAVFGLACYTEYGTLGSVLMSHFVNTTALLSYVPLTYLCDPFTITGHFFAARRGTFDAVGGLDGLEVHVGDDVMLGMRLTRAELRLVQTTVVYDVANELGTLRDYHRQMQRWFIFPRTFLLPYLTFRQSLLSFGGSLAGLIPSVLLVLGLASRTRRATGALAGALGVGCGVYLLTERRYLAHRAPRASLPLLVPVFLLVPLQILWALRSGNTVHWRGQHLRIFPDSASEPVTSEGVRHSLLYEPTSWVSS